ncbi:hypothetical protein Rhopal_007220-T1 [Rhodotorula paludigena]|uniref:Ribosome biogenesis protein SLX9 n=1 Tax=Rhodotorula paludigena TaxID=86838 RepID=A0AAV5GP62_9BASI|nr:hypothetical protein Rhopal_007220-T1 [Rhodotorula paludigena]
MGKSAKLTKRFSKADRTARKINAQSGPGSQQRTERSVSPDDAPRSAIPLFNTSARGRTSTKPDPRLAAAAAAGPASLVDEPAPVHAADGDVEPDLMDEGDAAAGPGSGSGGGKKKNKSLKDKVRAAKESLRADEQRSRDKLGGGANKGGKKGRKGNVLGSVDYVELMEKRPGKKFR